MCLYVDTNPGSTDACLRDAGKVDAYIKLELYDTEVVECVADDDMNRDIYLYPDQDLRLESYMNAELGIVE